MVGLHARAEAVPFKLKPRSLLGNLRHSREPWPGTGEDAHKTVCLEAGTTIGFVRYRSTDLELAWECEKASPMDGLAFSRWIEF